MQIIEMLLGKDRERYGINAISVVETPAILEDFIQLKSEEVQLKQIDEEKRLLLGAVLIPDQHILRKDKKGTPYYIYFKKETIREASQDFFKKGNQSNSTLQHETELSDMTVVESWIVEDSVHDKSVKYGMKYPVGTWVVAMKCENDSVWKEAKSGKVNGFSIEGYFTGDPTQLEAVLTEDEILINKIKDIINKE